LIEIKKLRKMLKKLDSEADDYDQQRKEIQTKIDYINVRIHPKILKQVFLTKPSSTRKAPSICPSSKQRIRGQRSVRKERRSWKSRNRLPREMLFGDSSPSTRPPVVRQGKWKTMDSSLLLERTRKAIVTVNRL
jgi:hypothetical protein